MIHLASGIVLRAVSAIVLTSALSACAISYIDANGDQHAIGLLDIVVRSPSAPETLAGDVVEITSLGLSVGQNAQGGFITAGYSRQTTAALRDSAFVLGNPIAALLPAPKNETAK
ncbi:MAG: hypothetical protein AB7H90_09360 [Alphaproteobacteria bacterium]